MLLNLRDNRDKLVIKDFLDIDFDMCVQEQSNCFYIRINRSYMLDEEFKDEKSAEERMRNIAQARNNLEYELKNY